MGRLPLVHALLAALPDRALGVAQNGILGAHAHCLQQFQDGNSRGAGAIHDHFEVGNVAAGDLAGIDDAGGGYDRRAVLVVMEDGNIEALAKQLLDDEAVGTLDVFQIDAAEGIAEAGNAFNEGGRVVFLDLDIDRVDVGEALEQDRLAFHHRLGRGGTQITEAENGGAVRYDGHHVALRRVVINLVGIGRDGLHGRRDAGRIGQRQVALGRHRLGRHHPQFAGHGVLVEGEGFVVVYGGSAVSHEGGVSG